MLVNDNSRMHEKWVSSLRKMTRESSEGQGGEEQGLRRSREKRRGRTRRKYCPNSREGGLLQEAACCQWWQMLPRDQQVELEAHMDLAPGGAGIGVLGLTKQVRRNGANNVFKKFMIAKNISIKKKGGSLRRREVCLRLIQDCRPQKQTSEKREIKREASKRLPQQGFWEWGVRSRSEGITVRATRPGRRPE